MKTITIHWALVFALPLAGGFIARWFYVRWQAWVVAAAMSLIGFLVIRFIGHSTNDYALGVIIGMIALGTLLPEVWQWTRGFTLRRAPWFIGGIICLCFYLANPGWLIYIACWGILIAAIWLMIRSLLPRPQRQRRQ